MFCFVSIEYHIPNQYTGRKHAYLPGHNPTLRLMTTPSCFPIFQRTYLSISKLPTLQRLSVNALTAIPFRLRGAKIQTLFSNGQIFFQRLFQDRRSVCQTAFAACGTTHPNHLKTKELIPSLRPFSQQRFRRWGCKDSAFAFKRPNLFFRGGSAKSAETRSLNLVRLKD